MSFELKQQIPDPELLLTLEPEELAGVLLPILKKQAGKDGKASGYNFANNFRQMQEIYPRQYVPAVTRAIMEAWDWLITSGLLAHDAEGHGGISSFSRARRGVSRGRRHLKSFGKLPSFPQSSSTRSSLRKRGRPSSVPNTIQRFSRPSKKSRLPSVPQVAMTPA